MCAAMLILAFSAMAQLKNRVPDDGTAVALGSMVKLNALGEISVCGGDDDDVAGIVTAIVPDGATNYYLITASDIYPARLSATVTAGDRLTTAAGGALRTAAGGEVTVGWALEDGHATELRKAVISLDYPGNVVIDWDTLAAYSDTTVTNLIFDSLAVYLLPNDTILFSDTAGFAWKIPCDSVNVCIDWDTLGAYADTSILWDTLAAYSDTTVTNLIFDSLAVYLLPNDTILFSDTAGFAWKIPCDSVNECIDWDTLGAYADTSVVWDTLAAYSDTTITNLILDSLAIYLLENDTILFSDTAGFAWKIPCDSVNVCIDWDTLGAYADTSVVWDTLAAYSDTTITNLILDSLAIYLLENDTILFSDTAGFAWKIPCDSVNVCIDWDTLGAYADTNVTNFILDSLGAYLDTTYSGDNLGNHIATENLQMSGYWVSNDGGNEGLYVDTDGKVGIGTNSPDEDLEVSSSGFTYIRSTTTADADAGVHLRATNVGSEGGANINQYALFIRGADNSGDFLINEDYIAGAYAPVTRFILENETGNIGIGLGADDPEAKLHVRGDIFVDDGNGFVGANPSGADSFYIYDPGDTTYFHSDNPLLITPQLHLGTVPDDAAPDTILTLSGNQVKKVLASSLGGGGGFTQLRANGSAWLTDSVTLVDGDVELTQTGDSIAFNVVWDTLSAYADTSVVWDTLAAYSDTTVTNLILDSLAVYLVENDTILFSDTAGFAWKIPCDSVNECIVWDTLADYALLDTLGAYADTSVVWDTLAEYALLDTLGAYLDTTNHFFTQLRANGSAWLPDSVTLVEGTGITLTQTGDSITIAASGGGGSDTDWSGAGTGQMYATDTDDSVAIGIAVPTAKLDVDGGITMRGDRYRGIDASGADSFYIYDDGDTTRFDADNPIKIGDASLVVGTNGYAYATKNLYAGDSFYIGDLEIDTANSVVLVADTATGKVGYAPLNFVGGAITRAYGELVMDDTSGVTVALPNSIAWTDMKTSESGIIAGAPFLTVGAGTNGSTAYADSLIIGDSGAHLYQLNLSVSFSGPSGCEFQMAVLRDGVILPKFILFSDIASANEKKSSSLSGLIEIDDGEVLTLKMRNYGDKGINITIYNFNLQITRVGD